MPASQRPLSPDPEWKGTDRYSILRRIGEGGMGVVYEALDRERSRNVALKTLLRFDPNSVYLFKQEFRALADVHHRNLVHLYELVQPGDGPLFFTMELVAGTDFLEYVTDGHSTRASRTPSATSSSAPATSMVTRKGRAAADHRHTEPAASLGDAPTPADPEKLRPALRQLVQGLRALHAAGKLHRDVKPSNVRVTTEGRVVLLDFGIALELGRAADESDGGILGTPLYISPERVAGEVATPASDWYAVGVILYEALAGRAPFEGGAMDLLMRKTVEAPLAPSTWARGIPPDLEELCVALLERAPSKRPDGSDILRRLGAVTSARPGPRGERAPQAKPELLVGREAQLRALRDAFESVATGKAVTLRVAGGAGMGKSALVQHFLDEVAGSGEVQMLCGRAYERESVPYKAVDSLLDSLARRLVRIEEAEGPCATPRHAAALARLFPVLNRVASFADLPEEPLDDAQSARHDAFGALRELLDSLARRRPLVLYVDDVQWGDVDSAALLHEVMRPPNAPPILLLMTYRDEEAITSPFLVEMNERWPGAGDIRDIAVGPLDIADVQRLALARIGAADENAERLGRAISREAKGSPFLVEELVRSNRTQAVTADSTLAILTLAQVVGDRLARLPKAARRLAEIVAVGGRPLTHAILASACGEPGALDEHIELLRSERLVRAGYRDGREIVEPSHDRIRETIAAQLPPGILRAHHGDLARAFEAASSADVEAIAIHLLGSGERERGARCAERAAEQAAIKLAFDQAARLYRLALETLPRTPDEARPLRIHLATALERSGRRAEAARVYLEAASGAPPLERIDLERSASSQLLLGGRTDEGVEVLRRVLAAVGMRAPQTALGAIVSLLFHRFMLALRGLRFVERSPEEVAPEDRVRVDALSAVAQGYSVVDVVLGACMQARLFRLALDVGDRRQVLRAASIQITHLASQGGPIGKAERAAYAIAERLSLTLGDPSTHAYFQTCRGLSFFHRGHWKKAHDTLLSRGAQASNDTLSLNRLFGVYSLFYLGQVREQARRATRLLAEAEQRGDTYTVVNLRAAPLVDASLAADEPDAGREHVRLALATWTQNGFHVQHWKAMLWETQIELYVGDGERAYARLERDRRAFRRSLLDHSQFVSEMTQFVRGCAAVASAVSAPPRLRRRRLAEARTVAKRLERQGMTWTAPLASIVLAAVANAEGNASAALAALRAAIVRAEAADMTLHAASARHQLGCLLGAGEGEVLRRQAEDEMIASGIRAPARIATMLVPGTWA